MVHLTISHGTLVCRGTVVGKRCSTRFNAPYLGLHIWAIKNLLNLWNSFEKFYNWWSYQKWRLACVQDFLLIWPKMNCLILNLIGSTNSFIIEMVQLGLSVNRPTCSQPKAKYLLCRKLWFRLRPITRNLEKDLLLPNNIISRKGSCPVTTVSREKCDHSRRQGFAL